MWRSRSAIVVWSRWVVSAVAGLAVVGHIGGLARAAQPGAPPGPPPSASNQPPGDLSIRYRFMERYEVPGEKPDPAAIGQFSADENALCSGIGAVTIQPGQTNQR